MARLFLSYSREDLSRVSALATALKERGHDLWWDRDIAGGAAFSKAIEEALDRADVVIVCWSAASVASDWVRDEAAAGRDSGRLVPLTLDSSQPPLGFRQYQTIDLSRWDGRSRPAALAALETAIAQRVGESGPRAVPVRDSAPSVRRPARRARVLGGAGLALAAVAAGIVVPRYLERSGALDPTVAVGAFKLASAGLPPELPATIGQEIVAAFGAENAVSVIAPGDRNGAAAPFVMDGSVTALGPAVRINVNLEDQASGLVLWSGAFEHEAADAVAARQAAVAASQVVRCGLWGASAYPRPMPDKALSLYLQWCNEHWSGSSKESAELEAAKRVTLALPDFSFGWSALALAAVPLAAAQTAEAKSLREEGIAAARKAMELDRLNPEGFMALAGLAPLDRFAEREKLLVEALGVRPTECGCERQAYGDFLTSVGRLEEAAEQYQRALTMRPLAPFSNLRLAQALFMTGRKEEAQALLDKALALWPDATSLRLLRIKSALWTGRYDEAMRILGSPDLPLTSDQRRALSRTFAALKSNSAALRAEAAAELGRLSRDRRTNDKLVIAGLAALGDGKSALDAAANLIRTRGLWQTEVLFEPNLSQARSEPGYAGLIERLGLARYWKAGRQTPDICRGAERPAFCP